jgi:hypothetical protein
MATKPCGRLAGCYGPLGEPAATKGSPAPFRLADGRSAEQVGRTAEEEEGGAHGHGRESAGTVCGDERGEECSGLAGVAEAGRGGPDWWAGVRSRCRVGLGFCVYVWCGSVLLCLPFALALRSAFLGCCCGLCFVMKARLGSVRCCL